MATERNYTEAIDDLEETYGIVPPPLDILPEDDVVHEWPTVKKYTVGESEIPQKYRELIGLAVAANIKCPYCTYFHTEVAKLNGATEAELEEAYALASFTTRYSSMLHAGQYDVDTFKDKVQQIEEHFEEQMEESDD